MVVAVHVAPEIAGLTWFTSFRMPLYFCLSGMFFKQYGGFSSFLIKKTDKLLIPFLGWYLISYLIYYIRVLAIGEPEIQFHISDIFYDKDFYNLPLWFLLSLFWCNIIYCIIASISSSRITQGILVLCFASLGWVLSYSGLINFLFVGTSLTCLPFFYMGQLIVSTSFVKNKYAKRDSIISGICVALAIVCLTVPKETIHVLFFKNTIISGNPVMVYILAASLVVLLLNICKYIGKIPYVSFLGRYSIIVLVTHGLINNIINRSVRHLIGDPSQEAAFHILLFVIIIGSMSLVIPFCKKFLGYITAQKNLIEEKFYSLSYQ